MSITLAAGAGDPIAIDSLADLQNAASTFLKLGNEFLDYLRQPISSLPAGPQSTTVEYKSGNQSWAPGAFTFTPSGGVSGKISVLTSGNLLSYTDGFATQIVIGLSTNPNSNTTKTMPIPSGKAFVCVELDFHLKGGISGKYNAGIYGVSGSASTNDTFTVAFYKRCDLQDILSSAIAAAISGFVLPLHANTLQRLQVGDYLHHNFNANLQLGLGASIGFDTVLYAGQYKSDIPRTANALALNAPSREPQLGAKLAFHFDYAGTFEALLWRESPNLANFHLYRSSKQDTSLKLDVGLTLNSNPPGSTSAMSTQLQSSLADLLPGSHGSAFKNDVWPKASPEISKYVNEASSALSAWLTSDSSKTQLELEIEKTRNKFLLLDYKLDLTAPAYAAAWGLVVGGRFLDAIEAPGSGVSIAVGSGLENLYRSATSINLNLFGRFTAAWSASVISNSSLVYAGNNIFHLISNEGRQQLSSINNRKREIDMYFAAEVDLSQANSSLATINLHSILQATNNRNFGAYISSIVSLLTSGSDAALLTREVAAMAAQSNTTEILHLIFPPSAYSRLRSSTLSKAGKPDDESKDQTNYAAFATACGDLITNSSPATFSFQGQPITYAIWRNWNIASNDQWPAPDAALPERTKPGSRSAGIAYLNHQFPQAGSSAQLISYALQAASDFMNLCADLKNLTALAAAESNLDTWNSLVARLKSIITNDVSQDFMAPAALALAHLCGGGPPKSVTGPAPGLTSKTSIGITMNYS